MSSHLEFKDAFCRLPDFSDIDAIHAYRNDPEVTQTLVGFSQGMSRENVREWIENVPKRSNDYVWVVADRETNVCIGHCGLYRVDLRAGKAEFGIALARKAWGKGLGRRVIAGLVKYGFLELRLMRIEAFCLSENAKMESLVQGVGFSKEGVLRKAFFRNGRFHDVCLFSILADDFPGSREGVEG